MYILDSNIFIKFLEGNSKVIELLSELIQDHFYISAITRYEILVGAHKNKQSLSEIKSYLDDCMCLDVSKKTVDIAIELQEASSLKFKDLLIAASAKEHDYTLVTADRDFSKIIDMKILHSAF